ncbi:hypothetical protein FBULB1_6489 [Fusarium bulbicola]|nr:hypothetical protein FBULB1_6489 [Fusarium bulbicola]
MAASNISSGKFANLCKRCACLQLTSTTLDAISPRDMIAEERGQEHEVDLLNETGFYTFTSGRDACNSCMFLSEVLNRWLLRNYREVDEGRVSLHYVFRFLGTNGYALKALRNDTGGDEFLIDCPITAATDLDMGMSLSLEPPLSHITDETLPWIESKVESCVLHNHFNPDKTFIPDRLIDVRGDQLSLVLTKHFQPRDAESHRYTALTYCWGPEPYASKQLKTTSVNIHQHLQHIPASSLPQVIKDAVAVTRTLFIPFLWVDALCILQDDTSDWDKQCAVMERIYGNAHLSLAAASSDNCEEGFIKKKDRIVLHFRRTPHDIQAFGIYSPPYAEHTGIEISLSAWFQRGWTFQERLASTRILVFAKENIHLICKFSSESWGRERISPLGHYDMLDRVAIHSGSTTAIYQEWNEVIERICSTTHELTRKTDFLPSIAGIASLLSKRLGNDYVAGMWKNAMHHSLCWDVSKSRRPVPTYHGLLRELETPSPYIAPSWSWASRHEKLIFGLYHPELAGCEPEFYSLETDVTLRGESVFGEVENATLIITSKVHKGSPRIRYCWSLDRKGHRRQIVRFDRRYLADIKPDFYDQCLFESSEPCTLAESISLLLISTIQRETDAGDFSSGYSDSSEDLSSEAPSDEEADAGFTSESSSASTASAESGGDLEKETISIRVAYGLLIHPTGNPNEYYRVGTFFSSPEYGGGNMCQEFIQGQYPFDPFENETLKNKVNKMAHQAPGSEPASTQRDLPKTPPSKKTSEYVFDSNGDTRIILSTSMAQTFRWVPDNIWIGDEKRRKKRKKKKGKIVEYPPPTTPPPASQEPPVTASTPLGGTTNEHPIDLGEPTFSDFGNVPYSRPEFSDCDETDPGCADPGTKPDSTSHQIPDWEYGETYVPHLEKTEFRMLVSGKHLELASTIFKTMVTGPFAEGKVDISGFRLLTASDWDPEAFKIVLTIMHGHNRDVPRSLSLEMLVKVAMIVNYYDCLESVELWTEIWLEALSQKLIETENFPIPADILDGIDIARQSALTEIFSGIYELLDRLREEQDCSFECSSMLLGVLTKELSRHGILHPRNTPPFDGFSIEDIKEMIEGLTKPQWYGTAYNRHYCCIQDKLSKSLTKVESELRVFDLQDFQTTKNHTRR